MVASHRGPDCNRVQDAYSLRCSPQVHGAARDTLDHCATVAGRELASAIDNPVVRGGPGRVQRQLPRSAGRLRPRLRGDRGCRRRLDQRASYGPVPGPQPQPRPAAVPRRRPGRGQRAHDRAVHPGRDRLGDEAARQPGQRRLHPVERDAGGPRLDGLVVRAQAAPFRRRADPGDRRRGAHRRPGARPAPAARAVARHRRRDRPAAQQWCPGTRARPAPLAGDRDLCPPRP